MAIFLADFCLHSTFLVGFSVVVLYSLYLVSQVRRPALAKRKKPKYGFFYTTTTYILLSYSRPLELDDINFVELFLLLLLL